jgi:hypothetical protein
VDWICLSHWIKRVTWTNQTWTPLTTLSIIHRLIEVLSIMIMNSRTSNYLYEMTPIFSGLTIGSCHPLWSYRLNRIIRLCNCVRTKSNFRPKNDHDFILFCCKLAIRTKWSSYMLYNYGLVLKKWNYIPFKWTSRITLWMVLKYRTFAESIRFVDINSL